MTLSGATVPAAIRAATIAKTAKNPKLNGKKSSTKRNYSIGLVF
jgi:hypothetical protein